MKIFEGENYYQILRVSANAGVLDIRRAYREILSIYEEESIASYSLFTTEQRKILLHTIEQAYATLIDEDKRAAYNRMLIDTGRMDAATFSSRNQRRLAAISEPTNTSKEKNLSQWVRKKAETPEIRALAKEIQAKELISGRDLKQLREAFGIDLGEIYAITKISNSILSMIEADQFDALPGEVYLKQFLKDYAGILQIDPHHVVQGYLTSMHQRGAEHE